MTITNEVLDELLSGVANADDLLGEQGLMKELKVRLMERMLGAELTEHLRYEPEAQPSDYQSNRRNGTTRKTLKGNDGALPIDVPRDRDGICGWLLHCKCFLVIFAVIFVSTVVCPACLCFGIASTGPDEFRERGSNRLIDLKGPLPFPECPCSWLT